MPTRSRSSAVRALAARRARDQSEIDGAFAKFAEQKVDGVIVAADAIYTIVEGRGISQSQPLPKPGVAADAPQQSK